MLPVGPSLAKGILFRDALSVHQICGWYPGSRYVVPSIRSGNCCVVYAFTKVFLRITSSCSRSADTFIPGVLLPFDSLNEYSLKLNDNGPMPPDDSLFS